MDDEDPLAHVRDRFHLPAGVIYLDGNSLGALPRHVPDRVAEVVEQEWGHDLVRAWNTRGWVDLPSRVGDRIGRLVGAPPGTVVVCDSTSINLYKVLSAALRLAQRPTILTDAGNFPSDLYVMTTLADVRVVEPEMVLEAIDDGVGVVALTEVDYRTGRRHDMSAITAATHAVGGLAVWDLAHSAGVLPVDVGGTGADFAVGCGYKYLNGGPGAPGFVYVAQPHQDAFLNPIAGWFGHDRPFDFSATFVPAAGVTRALVGTPHIVSLATLDAALDVFDGIDLGIVRSKSMALTALFVRLVSELIGEDLVLASPPDPSMRGSQISYRHPEGHAIMQNLIELGVVGDFRAPDVIRFGLAPLYIRFIDVFDAVERLSAVMATGSFRESRFAVRNPVT